MKKGAKSKMRIREVMNLISPWKILLPFHAYKKIKVIDLVEEYLMRKLLKERYLKSLPL
jgi:uncharacterized protein (DUF3820 family)